ncbi:sugar transporter [Cryptococcus deuterogattii 99/473]|uniref:Sugar transporter n=1 Tax=Cryptococcus deuterogattii Ram5 TaxID=1296110 RepID=A0A0D0V3N9_9TREE|nr:sugar transporter [Cryptococcus deuterogattii Ram5]KIY55473.1 sugar transporter [Cryptococcus deuterogattii 99/473]
MVKTHAPDREHIPPLSNFDIDLHPDTVKYVQDSQALADSLGSNGIRDVFASPIVFMAAFSACMGGLLFGFDQGILSIVLTIPQFLKVFPETDINVTSSAGLNKGVQNCCNVFLKLTTVVCSALQAGSKSFAMLVVGRFIGGIGVGVLSSTAPTYISEISPPNVRGAFLALEGSSIVIGIVIMFYITYATRHILGSWSFRLPFTVQVVPCIALGIGLWLLPYSPRWLATVGRDQDALDALVRLRRLPPSDPRLQAEWITIRAEAIQQREVVITSHPHLQGGSGFVQDFKLEMHAWFDMFKPNIITRTMIGVMLMVFQQLQGINALIYYSPTLFQQLGLDYEMQLTMSGVINVSQCVATIVAFFLLDRIGRKPPLLIGSTINSICHFTVAGLIAKYSNNWAAHQSAAWAGVGLLIAFMFFFGIGWSPVPWALPAEVHSSSRRAKGVAITTCTNWFFNFIVGLITPPMLQNIRYGTFIFFGAFAVISGIWAWFLCPETKGLTLEAVDQLFHNHTAHEELKQKHDIISRMIGMELTITPQSVQEDDEKKIYMTEHVETV